MRNKIITSLWLGLFCLAVFSQSRAEIPSQPQGRVSDFAGIIQPIAKAEINGLLEGVEQVTGAQIAVVTVDSLEGMTVEEYANKLFNQWGIGQKGKDNGVLLLVAHSDRKARIEVGYGLEGVINDGRAGRILDESIIPFFKTGDFSQGIVRGCEQIAAAITGTNEAAALESSHISQQEPVEPKVKIGVMLFLGLFISIGFLALGSGIRGEEFFIIWGAGFGGIPLVMSIVLGLFMDFPIYILPALALIMFCLGLFKGKKVIKVLEKSGGMTISGSSGSPSRSFSGGFSSGSSFGSFGGGSSGGGGASRSW